MKKVSLAVAIAVMSLGAVTPHLSAQGTSRYNPYRAFNHTGMNYGAQQWERRQARSGSGQAYVPAGRSPAASIVGTPSGRWSYSSAYRGAPVARPSAPACR